MCQALNIYMQSARPGEEVKTSSLQRESTGQATLQRLLWSSTFQRGKAKRSIVKMFWMQYVWKPKDTSGARMIHKAALKLL
jgi:hypothetical protein